MNWHIHGIMDWQNAIIKIIKILWWNVNRRLNEITKNISPIISDCPDIIFVSETSAGYDAIPEIDLYTKFADKDIKTLSHGGLAFYISKNISSYVFDISFSKSYVSFRLDFTPSLMFIGCYVQPEKSNYFDANLFSELCSFLITVRERKLIPIQ